MPSIDKAYKWAITWCNKPKVGYSREARNKRVIKGITYFDCSSFINYALIAGGFVTPQYAPQHNAFSTTSMGVCLKGLGFTEYETSSTFQWKAGDIGVNYGAHTEMCYKGGTGKAIFMGAHTAHVVLANQVCIGSSGGNPDYRRTFKLCYRYGTGKEAEDNGFSMYVISAICGNFWQESGVNPAIWESLKVPSEETTAYVSWNATVEYMKDAKVSYNGHNYHSIKAVPVNKPPSDSEYWDDEGAYEVYSKWECLNHGYGLGGWTNTNGDRHGRLYKLYEYCSDHEGVESMKAQAEYIVKEGTWHKGASFQQGVPYDSLNEFIHSTSTDLNELTAAWLYCWEGIDNGTLGLRQEHAKKVYDFLIKHEGDESESYIAENRYLTEDEILQNSLAFLNIVGGVIIADGEKGRKKRQMPVWMMVRYHF